jgi:hypothetical protein
MRHRSASPDCTNGLSLLPALDQVFKAHQSGKTGTTAAGTVRARFGSIPPRFFTYGKFLFYYGFDKVI